ncbi:uncharacterized protein LOC141536353 [Cotesia typhae]|uniref:uncharacterized protein LOC141536353 n=1 Tax=Cotesia typhae TaxID=2053667 RepID=UPI003D68D67E
MKFKIKLKNFDDAKSWISPNDGNLATENTPIYGVQRKPNLFGNGDVEYKIVKFRNAMKKVSDFLYKNQSYAIAPLNDQPSPTTEAPSSEGENLNPSTTAKPEPKKDMNTLIEEMMRKNLPNSELIVGQHQTTTPKPSLPYPDTVYPEVLVIIDNSLYKKLDSNILRTVIHTLGFFNGVDLLYRNLESPKFRLNIAAILIVQVNIEL